VREGRREGERMRKGELMERKSYRLQSIIIVSY